MKNHFSHKGLFGSQTKCFMAIPILSDSCFLSVLKDVKIVRHNNKYAVTEYYHQTHGVQRGHRQVFLG